METRTIVFLIVSTLILAACNHDSTQGCSSSDNCPRYCDGDTLIIDSCIQNECKPTGSKDCKALYGPDADCIAVSGVPTCAVGRGSGARVPESEIH